jgi:hypothetical protein
MTEHDTILAILQSDIGIAALIVVFAGFLLTKSETFETRARTTTPPRRLTKFRLPRARILRFTSTGKAISISEQMMENCMSQFRNHNLEIAFLCI